MAKFGFIGAGQMAKALAAGIANSDGEADFLISDPNQDARDAFSTRVGRDCTKVASNNREVFSDSETVFLAVKPQYFSDAVAGLDLDLRTEPLVISVIAGVPISTISRLTGINRIIRVMPNTPCLVGQGACGISFPSGVAAEDVQRVQSLLEPIGLVEVVPEPMLDVVTGLSGSGPAFVFAFMESLIAGAEQAGMPLETAKALAIQTVYGAAVLVKETGEPLAGLREKVTSPGGTTLSGLNALKEHGFQDAVVSAVEAATERSRELGSS